MSLFNIDIINTLWKLLVPPDKRLPKWRAWGASILAGQQWKQNAFFTGYMTGAQNFSLPVTSLPDISPTNAVYINTPAVFISTHAYAIGDTVIYAIQGGGSYFGDNAVYQCISAPSSHQPPTGVNLTPDEAPASANSNLTAASSYLSSNAFYWVKVQDNFLGANERVMYNASRLIFEYALNRWFFTTFRQPGAGTSDIYVQPNQLEYDMLYMGPSGNGFNFIPAGYGEAMPYVNLTSAPASLYNFTIYFPVAKYNNLYDTAGPVSAGSNSSYRDSAIMAFADQLNAAGMTYNIITY